MCGTNVALEGLPSVISMRQSVDRGASPSIGTCSTSIPKCPGRMGRRPGLRSRARSSIPTCGSTFRRSPDVFCQCCGSIRTRTWFVLRRDRVRIARRELPCDAQSVPEHLLTSRSHFRIKGGRPGIEGEQRPVTWIASDHEVEHLKSVFVRRETELVRPPGE